MKKKRSNSREKILKAAMRCFSKEGFAGVRLSDVAKAAKVDHSLVLYHFPTMEELHHEVILVVLDELKTHVVESLEATTQSQEDPLRVYITSTFQWAKEHPKMFSIWMYFFYQATYQSRFRTLNTGIRHTGRERIQRLIYEGVAKRRYTVEPDRISQVALDIHGLMTGHLVMTVSEDGLDYATMAKATVERAMEWVGAA